MLRPYQIINRRKSNPIFVGNVKIGGDAPISVQTVTNTLTTDVKSTISQIKRIEKVGADLVRVSIPDQESAKALKEICKKTNIPIIADIHFHYKRAIEAAESGAACLRINPGNIGSVDRIKEVIKAAKNNNCSIRIGVNAGSLEKNILEKYKEPTADALVESALYHASLLQDNDFNNFKISVKASDIFLTISAYEKLADKIDVPFHIGITEAGGKRAGTVKSSIGLGYLLLKGIGDTIRVSLSADPVEEVKVAFDLLKTLGIRNRGVKVISCPSCSRQQFDVISTVNEIEEKLSHINTPVTVSIIGCVVNGPGEAKKVDIGLTGGGRDTHQIYISGIASHRLINKNIVDHVVDLVENYVQEINETKRTIIENPQLTA